MHGRLDEKGNNGDSRDRNFSVGFLALPLLLVIVLVTLAIVQPSSSNWIAEAVQAEFTGDSPVPSADLPTQFAQPAMQIRTVDAH